MRPGLRLIERWYALSGSQQAVIGGGMALAILLLVFRKPPEKTNARS